MRPKPPKRVMAIASDDGSGTVVADAVMATVKGD
jgi:hypothetical protein